MTNSTAQFEKLFKQSSEFGAQYSDACSKSSAILMKGFENIVTEVMAFAQSSAEKQAKFAKEAMSVKTINEFAEVQNKIAQTNFDDFMSGATKISEISVKVLTDGVEPVNSYFTKAVQQATDAMAA